MNGLDDVLATAGDPSLPLALAALVREADDGGRADFAQFAAAFRSEVQGALAEAAGGMPELSGDEVHENLTASVLPRLVEARLIAANPADQWHEVQAAGTWWDAARADRDATRVRLI